MKEFYANDTSSVPNTGLNWLTPATVSVNVNVVQDTSLSSSSYYYNFYCDSVNWSNCDYYYNLPGAKTTCTINTTGSFDNSNTNVFLSMNGANVVTRIYSTSYNAISTSFVSYLNSIPEGSNYTVVAVSFDGTNYYYGSQTVTMTSNMVINMPALTQTTLSQIKTNLTSLP